jgi:hypothetical protein
VHLITVLQTWSIRVVGYFVLSIFGYMELDVMFEIAKITKSKVHKHVRDINNSGENINKVEVNQV